VLGRKAQSVRRMNIQTSNADPERTPAWDSLKAGGGAVPRFCRTLSTRQVDTTP
jgi:hypothetical protein